MSARKKLASGTHYKTAPSLSKKFTGSAPVPAPVPNRSSHRSTTVTDKSGYESKQELKSEAKAIMDRVNKITDEFTGTVCAVEREGGGKPESILKNTKRRGSGSTGKIPQGTMRYPPVTLTPLTPLCSHGVWRTVCGGRCVACSHGACAPPRTLSQAAQCVEAGL